MLIGFWASTTSLCLKVSWIYIPFLTPDIIKSYWQWGTPRSLLVQQAGKKNTQRRGRDVWKYSHPNIVFYHPKTSQLGPHPSGHKNMVFMILKKISLKNFWFLIFRIALMAGKFKERQRKTKETRKRTRKQINPSTHRVITTRVELGTQ